LQPNNSYNLKKFAKKRNLLFHETRDINSKKTFKFLRSVEPDVIFSSWPKILKKKIIELPKIAVIGSHPTDLPLNRGRHPLHWLIAMGNNKSALTFYIMDEKIDNGAIIKKIKFSISKFDNIKNLEHKIGKIAVRACEKIGKQILTNKLSKTKQRVSKSNYLRKRNLSDLLINLKMNFNSIKLLVNSFIKPYEGSILIIEDKILRVSKITKIKNKDMSNIEIGKLLKINQSYVITRCQDAIIKINFYSKYKYRKNKISYIYDPLYYILKSKKLFMNISKLSGKNK
jgi:methionyl-tRNA formyltransferase